MDNKAQQLEELEVLSSIYGPEWKREFEESDSSYSIEINSTVKLYITLPENYPSRSPPTYQLLAPELRRDTKVRIGNALDEVYLENIGGPVIYQWIECLRQIVNDVTAQENVSETNDTKKNKKEENEEPQENNTPTKQYNIIHGECIVDRKSTFQGHYCEVHSQNDVKNVLEELMKYKRIAQATHNMFAYRIATTKTILQDCDDDGESHAGSRLLHLLQILDVRNVLVVVSRWYGGIHLGPDRFRHINNAARQVLEQAGVLKKS